MNLVQVAFHFSSRLYYSMIRTFAVHPSGHVWDVVVNNRMYKMISFDKFKQWLNLEKRETLFIYIHNLTVYMD